MNSAQNHNFGDGWYVGYQVTLFSFMLGVHVDHPMRNEWWQASIHLGPLALWVGNWGNDL